MADDKAYDYRQYRQRAEELRTIADSMIHADTANILRHLADQHDAMADRSEAQAAKFEKPVSL